jgi:hypothetical protein
MARSNRWLLNLENQRDKTRWCIKRWVYPEDGKSRLERYPVKKYKHIRDNLPELRRLIIRLNERSKEQKCRIAVEPKSADRRALVAALAPLR